MNAKYKYCWIDIKTGKFSNSWGENEMKYIDAEMLQIANKDGWKLIKYECINDVGFEFYIKMKLTFNK